MRPLVCALLLIFLIIPATVQGLVTYSDGTVIVDQPITDDLIVSGGVVRISAPVQSLIAAGGNVELNGPVEGDVIAAGGEVIINGDIGGKAVLAGGKVTVNGNISRNLIVYGGEVLIAPSSTIGKDASISGGTVVNKGHVAGVLHVSGKQVENLGTAGSTDIEIDKGEEWGLVFSFFKFAFGLGMLILGFILLTAAPKRFLGVAEDIRNSPLLDLAIGIAGLVAGLAILFLLMITIVGIPVAILITIFYVGAVLLSTLFVSMALGNMISNRIRWNLKNWQKYILGFVLLYASFLIPIAGTIVMLAAVSLGFGAILHAIFQKRTCILENYS